MKNLIFRCMPVLLIVMLFSACQDKVIRTHTYTANVPEYLTYAELRQSVKNDAGQPLISPGKIYLRDHYIFINEKHKGIHIYDNSNPQAPVKVNFISIPGNIDMAIRGNYLYADSYVDLVVIDLSDLSNTQEVNRIENAFENFIPDLDYNMQYPCAPVDLEKGVVVGWHVEKVTETTQGQQQVYLFGGGMYDMASSESFVSNAGGNIRAGSVSLGGSMARFNVYNDYLYTVNQSIMQVFDISAPTNPIAGAVLNTERIAETLFVNKGNLFVGTQSGMLIYSLENPPQPVKLGELNHITSCDPVVVEGNTAYVTLRSGNFCGGWANQLDVIDISTLMAPELMQSYPMANPHGLGIDNGTLFICDGEAGLKVYDATDPMQISDNQIAHFSGITAYDVIPFNYNLLMISEQGLYQYDYSNLENLELLSIIPVQQP